jgi:ABC-type glutathione transport system ATPase component
MLARFLGPGDLRVARGPLAEGLPRLGGCRWLAKKAKKKAKAGAAEPSAKGSGSGGNVVLTMNGVSKRVPGRTLLDNVSLSFLQGAKIGVLGANGAGKSTLLKVVGGMDTEIEGEIWVKPGLTIGYMHQEPHLDPSKDVLANVLDGVRDEYSLVRRYDEIADEMAQPDADLTALIDEQATVSDSIDALGCWDLLRDVQSAMRNLRCPPADADVSTLSGGERRRVALCRLLLSKPDVLMLVSRGGCGPAAGLPTLPPARCPLPFCPPLCRAAPTSLSSPHACQPGVR